MVPHKRITICTCFQVGFASLLLGPHSLLIWITTPVPTASAQLLLLEESALLVSTALEEAQSLCPAVLGFTAMLRVGVWF